MEDQSPYKIDRLKLAIDPKELRIGNYLKCGEEVGVVKMIAERGFQVDSKNGVTLGNSLWSDFSHIPLTEEILIKAGFENGRVEGLFSLWVEKTEPNNIAYRKFNLQLNDGRFYFNIRPGLEINYLHHLQNLYFALTGKELEIKL